jgi:hypothetical protein
MSGLGWHCGAALAGALSLGVLLAGCGASPVASISPSPSAPAASNGQTRPTQVTVAPPSSESGAVEAATNVVRADETALFEIFEGRIPGDSLHSFETGSWLMYTNDFVNQIGDQGNIDGARGRPDLWLPDSAKSAVSTLVDGAKLYRFGTVELLGCFKSRWDFVYTSDAPTPAAAGFSPYEVTVQYQPARRVWLITHETDLTRKAGAPTCPPPGS